MIEPIPDEMFDVSEYAGNDRPRSRAQRPHRIHPSGRPDVRNGLDTGAAAGGICDRADQGAENDNRSIRQVIPTYLVIIHMIQFLV